MERRHKYTYSTLSLAGVLGAILLVFDGTGGSKEIDDGEVAVAFAVCCR